MVSFSSEARELFRTRLSRASASQQRYRFRSDDPRDDGVAGGAGPSDTRCNHPKQNGVYASSDISVGGLTLSKL
jgi:hypothetical protein